MFVCGSRLRERTYQADLRRTFGGLAADLRAGLKTPMVPADAALPTRNPEVRAFQTTSKAYFPIGFRSLVLFSAIFRGSGSERRMSIFETRWGFLAWAQQTYTTCNPFCLRAPPRTPRIYRRNVRRIPGQCTHFSAGRICRLAFARTIPIRAMLPLVSMQCFAW